MILVNGTTGNVNTLMAMLVSVRDCTILGNGGKLAVVADGIDTSAKSKVKLIMIAKALMI